MRVVLQGCGLKLLLLGLRQALNLIVVNLLLNLDEEFLLVLDLVLLEVLHFLLHFGDRVTAWGQDEASFFLLLSRPHVSWNGIAEHLVVYFALGTLRFAVEVLV